MSFNQRVFKQREQSHILDVSVTILCDFSGSMGGNPIHHACQSMLILNDIFTKINVPAELLGFTTRGGTQDLSIFKRFNKKVTNEVLADRLRTAQEHMSGNADGESIYWAHDLLAKQRTKRKILLVLSDGQPAGGTGGDIYGFTKDVIKEIETRSPVEIMGIGIMTNSVTKLYKNHVVIDHAGELENALLTVLKNIILH